MRRQVHALLMRERWASILDSPSYQLLVSSQNEVPLAHHDVRLRSRLRCSGRSIFSQVIYYPGLSITIYTHAVCIVVRSSLLTDTESSSPRRDEPSQSEEECPGQEGCKFRVYQCHNIKLMIKRRKTHQIHASMKISTGASASKAKYQQPRLKH